MSELGRARFEAPGEANVSVNELGDQRVQLLGWRRQVDHHAYAMQPCELMGNRHTLMLLSLCFDPTFRKAVGRFY